MNEDGERIEESTIHPMLKVTIKDNPCRTRNNLHLTLILNEHTFKRE